MNQKIPLYEDVAAKVALMVDNGTFKPGERIPSIRDLSRKFKVSINTVKVAYGHLEDRRVIEARPQSGYYVCAKFPEIPKEPEFIKPEVNLCDISKGDLVMKIMGDIMDESKIQFGAAIPDPELIPSKKLAGMLSTQTRKYQDESAKYSMPPGSRRLRVQISKRLLNAGCSISPDEIIITTGATEAVFLALRTLCKPGDTLAIGSPVYFNFMRMIQELGLNIIEIPSSPRDGINMEALSIALEQNNVSACLIVTNFNNPLGYTLSDERKRDIVELLLKHNVPLIEDDINGDLSYSGERPSVCKGFDKNGNVLLCSSFSKTIAPGYRVGWIVPGRFIKKIQELKVISNIASATPPQLAVAEFLLNGGYDAHLRSIRKTYAVKVARMSEAVGEFFPKGTRVTRPKGGFNLWVELPEKADSMKLYVRAEKKGISIAPGTVFSTSSQFKNCLRLNAALWSDDKIWSIKELGKIAQELI